MKLGLMLGYSGAQVEFPIDLVKLAEKLGYDSVWTSEAYGSDAMTPPAWIAAQTHASAWAPRSRSWLAGLQRCARCRR